MAARRLRRPHSVALHTRRQGRQPLARRPRTSRTPAGTHGAPPPPPPPMRLPPPGGRAAAARPAPAGGRATARMTARSTPGRKFEPARAQGEEWGARQRGGIAARGGGGCETPAGAATSARQSAVQSTLAGAQCAAHAAPSPIPARDQPPPPPVVRRTPNDPLRRLRAPGLVSDPRPRAPVPRPAARDGPPAARAPDRRPRRDRHELHARRLGRPLRAD
jgi:hypothetical protein